MFMNIACPGVPGLPVLGNLLQLGEKKPHRTFTKWAEKYGPIYSVRTGQVNNVVISSPELAKEVSTSRLGIHNHEFMPLESDIREMHTCTHACMSRMHTALFSNFNKEPWTEVAG